MRFSSRFCVALVALCFLVALSQAENTKTTLNSLPVIGTLSSTQYTGYVTVNETFGVDLFYWFCESLSKPSTDPLVMWLTGGPGCSSLTAYFYENGPYHFDANNNNQIYSNQYTWNSNANVIWVDQPAGTGFSTAKVGGYVHGEELMADELYTFLEGWFELFPEFKGREFHIIAESYGGHYAPSIAYKIINTPGSSSFLNLQSVSIGNGMTDPIHQYAGYGPFALGRGIIDYQAFQHTEKMYASCKASLEAGKGGGLFCNGILAYISSLSGPINEYNVAETCAPNLPLCYNFTGSTDYLNRADVQAAIGVNKKWEVCTGSVHQELAGDWFNSQQYMVPDILEAGVRVYVYNGANGYICNFLGSEAWVQSMKWKYQSEFNSGKRTVWMVDQNIAGYVLQSHGLSLLTVNNAGHMVPQDQPKSAANMLNNILNNTPFPQQ